MQARSFDARKHRAERLLVKYKRVKPDLPDAWLRVRVFDAKENQSPGEFLRGRKPPEPDLRITKNIEDNLKLAGKPAARITYAGPFEPDTHGPHDFTFEIITIRRGKQIFEFVGIYQSSETHAERQVHRSFESISFLQCVRSAEHRLSSTSAGTRQH